MNDKYVADAVRADERDERYWKTHCWFDRFEGVGCNRPATWRGPRGKSVFLASWRACDAHRMATDEPLPPQEREGEGFKR